MDFSKKISDTTEELLSYFRLDLYHVLYLYIYIYIELYILLYSLIVQYIQQIKYV